VPRATHLAVSCDAPGCSATLEHQGSPLFETYEQVLEAIDDLNWIVHANHRGVDEFYCPLHWRFSFRMKVPYWGRRPRRIGF
jgi:hypothetical protein